MSTGYALAFASLWLSLFYYRFSTMHFRTFWYGFEQRHKMSLGNQLEPKRWGLPSYRWKRASLKRLVHNRSSTSSDSELRKQQQWSRQGKKYWNTSFNQLHVFKIPSLKTLQIPGSTNAGFKCSPYGCSEHSFHKNTWNPDSAQLLCARSPSLLCTHWVKDGDLRDIQEDYSEITSFAWWWSLL